MLWGWAQKFLLIFYDKELIWAIQFQKIKTISESSTKAQSTEKKIKRHVKKKEWGDLGFSTELTLEQAKNVAKHLNAELKISRQERLRNKLVAKRELENLKDCAYLPQVFVQEFEKMVLQPKGIREDLISFQGLPP